MVHMTLITKYVAKVAKIYSATIPDDLSQKDKPLKHLF